MFANHFWQGKQFAGSDPEFNLCCLGPVFTRGSTKQGVAVTWTALTGKLVLCGESQWHFPHKPPNVGGAHDAQGLLLRRVGKSLGWLDREPKSGSRPCTCCTKKRCSA